MISKGPSSSNNPLFKLWPDDAHGVRNWILILLFFSEGYTVEPGCPV